MTRKFSSLIEMMHDSPLVRLRGREATPPRASLWGKLELFLPGAMKDRVALQCVEDAEADGRLQPGGLIVETSSGTLALGLARVAALKGYRLKIVSDPRMDSMLLNKLRALGAEIEIVPEQHPTGGWQLSRLARVLEILKENPDAFWTQQYDTPSNAGAYRALAQELTDALGTDIGALVGSVGSGGSLTGTARFLREKISGLRVVAVDAVGSVLFHQPPRNRLQSGHGNNIVAGNVDYGQVDEVHWISDGEAFNACREMTRREGIFGGGSSGACYVVASWVARNLPDGQHVVTILPDSGYRYSELIYSEKALAKHGLLDEVAGAGPRSVRYALDVAERWSYAEVPHDGSVPYFAPDVRGTLELTEELREQHRPKGVSSSRGNRTRCP